MYSHQSNQHLVVGSGSRFEAAKIGAKWGRNCLLIVGGDSLAKSGELDRLEKSLKDQDLSFFTHHIRTEPDPDLIDSIVAEAKKQNIDFVLAVGGGSVLDGAKAIAAMICEEASVQKYLEGVGTLTSSGKTLPLLALPTTSGTGSEATKNAVISRPGIDGFKKSLRHDNYIPQTAILDPELLISCPPETTIYSGLDAFTQLFESFISTKATVISDMYAHKGLELFLESFPKVIKSPHDTASREKMALASYFSGISLANAGLGTVHGIAGTIGGIIKAPHGKICSVLIPPVYKFQLDTLRPLIEGKETDLAESSLSPMQETLPKFLELGRLMEKTILEKPQESNSLGEKPIYQKRRSDSSDLSSSAKKEYFLECFQEGIARLESYLPHGKLSIEGNLEKDRSQFFELVVKKSGDKNSPIETSSDQKLQFLRSIFQ